MMAKRPPVPRARVRLGVDARRAHVMSHAYELFGERPYDEISIDQLARQMGISKGLLYHYFGGKLELYQAVLLETMQRLRDATVPEAGAPTEQARSSMLGFVAFAEREPRLFRAVLVAEMNRDSVITPAIRELRAALGVGLLRISQIEAPSQRLTLATTGWMIGVDGMVLSWLDAPVVSREELVELVLDTWLALIAGVK